MKNIYYFFSSITFIQLYISIVIESNKRKINNIFIIRKNIKQYADPTSYEHLNILKKYSKIYNFQIEYKENINFDNLDGIVFMVDGDIYGPPRENIINDSMLFLIKNNKKLKKISLTEHMNFWDVYHHFIDYVDYCFFSNEHIIKQIKLFKNSLKINDHSPLIDTSKEYENKKNIFLGNTKYDNIPNEKDIYKKYKLNKNEKYVLFLFPKIRDIYKNNELLNIYSYLEKLSYKIIVKKRPKDKEIPKELRGFKLINSDTYPNESLELMNISNLVIISSSSANEETIMAEVPCLDLISDKREYERNEYLLDNKVYKKINYEAWKDISFDDFSKILNSFEQKKSTYFKNIKKKYLFEHANSAEKYLDFLL